MPGGKGLKLGEYTHTALRRKVEAKDAHQVELAKAVALNASGAGGAMKVAGMVEGCSVQQVKTAIFKHNHPSQRPAWAIMTEVETQRLVKWVLASASNDNPATESEVSEQVAKMLQCRRLAFRKARNGKEPFNPRLVDLSPAEHRLALEGGNLSHTWFMGFYAANPSCQFKTAHKQEAKRVPSASSARKWSSATSTASSG